MFFLETDHALLSSQRQRFCMIRGFMVFHGSPRNVMYLCVLCVCMFVCGMTCFINCDLQLSMGERSKWVTLEGVKPNFPETLFHPKYPALLYFAFFWNVPGSCCSDLTHLNLSLRNAGRRTSAHRGADRHGEAEREQGGQEAHLREFINMIRIR